MAPRTPIRRAPPQHTNNTTWRQKPMQSLECIYYNNNQSAASPSVWESFIKIRNVDVSKCVPTKSLVTKLCVSCWDQPVSCFWRRVIQRYFPTMLLQQSSWRGFWEIKSLPESMWEWSVFLMFLNMKTFWRHVQPPHAWTVINKDIFMETGPEILLSWDVTSTQEETSANLNIIIVDVMQTSFNTRWWSAAGKTTLNIKNDIYWEFWIL